MPFLTETDYKNGLLPETVEVKITITADEDESLTRTYGDKQIFVGLNTKKEAVESTFAVELATESELIDVYNGVTYTVEADGTVAVNIPGNIDGGTVILVPAESVEEPVDPEVPVNPEEPVDPEEPGDIDTPIVGRLDLIRASLDSLTNAVENLSTENPAIIEELTSIWAEYDRLRKSGDATDSELDALTARIAALLAIVNEYSDDEVTHTETDTESDSVTDVDADSEITDKKDDLPPTGETNNLMFALLGFVFIGGGTALALTFKKKEQID